MLEASRGIGNSESIASFLIQSQKIDSYNFYFENKTTPYLLELKVIAKVGSAYRILCIIKKCNMIK